MSFNGNELLALISAYFWPFVRISTMLMTAPIFGAAAIVPKKIRLLLALTITVIVVPMLPPASYVDPLSSLGLLMFAQQLLLGYAMAFLLQMAFAAVMMGGSSISMPMGLGFANMVDPLNGLQVPVLSTFFTIIGTLLFLSINGHLIMLQVLVDSFTSMPVGPMLLTQSGIFKLVVWGGQIFAGGILIALPAVIIITLINIAFGVMTRAAPQLNIFAVGFPTTMSAGFLVIFLTLPNLLPRFTSLVQDAFKTIYSIIGAG